MPGSGWEDPYEEPAERQVRESVCAAWKGQTWWSDRCRSREDERKEVMQIILKRNQPYAFEGKVLRLMDRDSATISVETLGEAETNAAVEGDDVEESGEAA